MLVDFIVVVKDEPQTVIELDCGKSMGLRYRKTKALELSVLMKLENERNQQKKAVVCTRRSKPSRTDDRKFTTPWKSESIHRKRATPVLPRHAELLKYCKQIRQQSGTKGQVLEDITDHGPIPPS
ncbi:hypothetical protein AVEN_39635-1 [Araneus ventricosus]|uniref:Uncharacterized protein n=1 Tax=Araneus ventricosus TaxID=182803 RepID=A0A4Y2PJQ4_ARAVE|nr:hypothetical protein AVEN_39635-1 [Araneus ventricosus]